MCFLLGCGFFWNSNEGLRQRFARQPEESITCKKTTSIGGTRTHKSVFQCTPFASVGIVSVCIKKMIDEVVATETIRRSTRLSYSAKGNFKGAGGIRTHDMRVMSQVLHHVSRPCYPGESPIVFCYWLNEGMPKRCPYPSK